MVIAFVVSVCLLIFLLVFARPLATRRRRARLKAQPFPEGWREVLRRRVPLVQGLPPELRRQLEELIKVFVAEKVFVGCGGLEVTEEMKVTVAAQACLLLLNRETGCYPGLTSVLVYPEAFIVPREIRDAAGVHHEQERILLGESWEAGKVILAWGDVVYGAADPTDGENVVIHEFAHQLDQETGETNGLPLLPDARSYARWAAVWSREFENFRRRVDAGEDTLIDPAGAEEPGEFFAYATEVFFELPHALAAEHADLYGELKAYFRVDPAEWVDALASA